MRLRIENEYPSATLAGGSFEAQPKVRAEFKGHIEAWQARARI